MKVLCPIDFSESSVNALHYGLELFRDHPNLEVTLIHCINLASRSLMFMKIDDMLKEKAEKDFEVLIEKKRVLYPKVNFQYQIYSGDPKHLIPAYDKKYHFDFVVIGTTGMSELKDIVIGSLTETLFEKSSTPVVAVPKDSLAIRPKNILVAIDDTVIENSNIFSTLRILVQHTNAHLYLCHVKNEQEDAGDGYVNILKEELDEIKYDYKALEKTGDLSDVLDRYAEDVDADMITFIHRHRTWWQRLFSTSNTKEGLFRLRTPMLILNGDHK